MKNKMDDLRNHLFDALEQLVDPDSAMDVERAKAVVEVGKVLVDTAKVEVEFLKHVGGLGSGFMSAEPKNKQLNAGDSIN